MNERLVTTIALAGLLLAHASEPSPNLDALPLYFIENGGQTDPEVEFYVRGSTTNVYFSARAITFALTDGETRWAVKLHFPDAQAGVHPKGLERRSAVVSYFKGRPENWSTGNPTYSGILYPDLWPGIDLVYTGDTGRLKYHFVVHPGADPSQIRVAVEGGTDVHLTEEGRLAVSTPLGDLLDDAPYSYQERDGRRVSVSSAFVLQRDGGSNVARFGFETGPYDATQTLLIDPVVRFSYSGFIGGTGTDYGYAVAVDGSGNAYVAGQTFSTEASFPVAAGPDLSFNGSSDAFVCKVDSTGKTLVYCGFIGGSATDSAEGIAVDASGQAYVTGGTLSTEATFPIVGGLDPTSNGASDAFVAKLHKNGTSLLYSGFLGGTGGESGRSIAVDAAGNAYITGETSSTEASFPVVGPLDPTFNGSTLDAFVAKVDASGGSLVYSGYIGGASNDEGHAIAVDASGSAYVAGRTGSTEATFPVLTGPDTTSNGGTEAFVAKVNPSGTALDYAGYIGGSGWDEAFGIAVDGSGNAYVAGVAGSDETTFPETVGPDLTYNGGPSDGFIAKVSASGATLIYCGYIGGAQGEQANAVAVDASGRAYVAGQTLSDALSFPLALGPTLTFGGQTDGFVSSIDAAGTRFVYSGYIGGVFDDLAKGIAVDATGAAYVAGLTASPDTSFPVVGGPRLLSAGGSNDAFVSKVVIQPSVVKLVGFETQDATEIVSFGTGAAADGITVRPGSGLFSLRQLTAPTVLASGLTPLTTLGLRFSFLKPSNPAAARTLIQFKNGAANLFALELRTDGILQVREDEALGLPVGRSGLTPLTNGTWYTVGLAYDNAAGGIVRVWLDASLEIDITHATSGTATNGVEIVGNASAYNFDDFYLTDTAAAPPLGQIVRLYPNGPGSASEFDTLVSSNNREQNVDELSPNDADFNRHAATTVATDLYSLDDSPAGAINAVKGMWRMRRGSGSSGGTHDYAWRAAGITGSAPFPGITTAFLLYEEIWEAPPEGGGDWAQTQVDGLELGASHNGNGGQDTELSFTTAMVDYDSSGSSGGTLSCAPVVDAWYDSTFQFRKKIIIDHTKVTGDLTDFPVLVSLSDADLALGARADGFDIFFTDQDGMTKLPHQIESYDGAGNLVAWVKLPDLLAGLDHPIYMYYGNPSSPDQQDVANTWTAGYEAVWHLSEASGAGAYLLNSALNDHHGTPTNTTFVPTGKAAGARRFTNGGTETITVANDALLFNGWSQFTLEFWIYPDYVSDVAWEGAGEDLFLNGSGPMRLGRVRRAGYEPAGEGSLQIDVQFATFGTTFNITPLKRQQWNHIVWNYNGTDYQTFANGVENSRDPIGNDALINTTSLYWGDIAGSLNGMLDEVRISTAGRSTAWIQTEYNNQSAPSSFYNVCPEQDFSTTAVELVSFTAKPGDGEVLLEWQTGSELRNLGFHLYRSPTAEGPYERITTSPIPGLGSSPEGASYSYRDGSRPNGVRQFYWLEDIETTGITERHGPVSATPQTGLSTGGGASQARITFGNPEGNTFRMVRGNREVTLELVTEGFYAIPEDDGRVRLEVPGLEDLAENGTWTIPVKRASVEALPGRKVNLGPARSFDVVSLDGLALQDIGASELVGTPAGVALLSRRPRGGAPPESLFPEEEARLLSVAFHEEVKLALVELAPLRWDATANRLLLTRRLVVPLSFREPDPEEKVTREGGGRRYRRHASHERRPTVARIATTKRGLQAVSYEDLFGRNARRRRADSTGDLRLSRLGKTTAFHVEPDPERFEPGSTLFFVSDGPDANPYGWEAVYELELGAVGERMSVRDAAPEGPAVDSYLEQLEVEENHLYQAGLVGAPDLWLWDVLVAPVKKSYPFHLSELSPSSTPASLDVRLQGTSDLPEAPDHHVRVYVNGALLGETSWDGKGAEHIETDLSPGVLREGENLLEVENVGDTGASYSVVMLDGFTVTYPRRAVALEGELEGRFSRTGSAEVQVGDDVFVTTTGAEPTEWLRGLERDPEGVVRFHVQEGDELLLTSRTAVERPLVRAARPSLWKQKTLGADSIVIGPRAYLSAAARLLDHRRAQGLRVLAVPLEELYDEFGFGEPRPEAVKDFLSYAYHFYEAPSPRYVLLLGDATYDFKDYLGTGVPNVTPPFLLRTSYLWTASDPAYAAVNDDDLLPDMAIGRLPAATLDELRIMIDKILAYESGDAQPFDSAIVLVTDDADGAGNFDSDAAELTRTVLASRRVKRIALSELGVDTTRQRIVEAFDRGASVVSYLGHGGIHLWATEDLFDLDQVDRLQPQPEQPFVLTMNCLNGYFHFPYFDSLSERLLKAEGKGAVATLSPSGLSLSRPAHLYHRAVLEELLGGSHPRLGDAIVAAEEDYLETGALPEILSIYQLFGDPALVIQRD